MMLVSVLVAGSTAPGRRAADTLRSLAEQTLSPERFEIVFAGSTVDDSPEPTLQVRRVRGTTQPLSAALAMARGLYVTVIEPGDLVTPGYLESMLAAAGPTRVAAAAVDETIDDSHTIAVLRPPDTDHAISPYDLPAALIGTVGKLGPTSLLRGVGLTDSETIWVRAFARSPFDLGRPRPSGDAVYTRRRAWTEHETIDFAAGVSRHLDALEQLRRVDHPAARPIVEALVERTTRRINAYLRRHPHQHRSAVEEIRRRGLTDIRWDLVNRGVARDLAILYTALPYADTSALVAARRIRAAGVLRDVVSNDVSSRVQRDAHGDVIWREFIDEQIELGARPQDAWWPGAHEFCDRGLAAIEARHEIKGVYRSVYSRVMWPTSHLLGALYKVRYPQTTWIAEFSDPLVRNVVGERRQSSGRPRPEFIDEMSEALAARGVPAPGDDNMYVWIETLAFALADTIVFTNDHQSDFMLAGVDAALARRVRRSSVVETHPVLPSEFYYLVEPDYKIDRAFVNVAYFGYFYITRGLTEVLDAIRGLPDGVRSALRLHVFTAKPEALADEVRYAGLDDTIIVNGYVSHIEFLNLTTRFDALLVNDYRTLGTHEINPYLPAKVSDYMGSGTPIWGIVEPGSLLSTRPLAYRSELGDVAGARAVLERIVAETVTVP